MFFDTGRILAVREMILAKQPEDRKNSLLKIVPMQREDFLHIFEEMAGLPVTVRLLDPPLHEFLPHSDVEIDQLAKSMNLSLGVVRQRVAELHESNPMLGPRGCRLGVTYPEIYEAQIQALIEAAAFFEKKTGNPAQLEIMIPLISLTGELRMIKSLIVQEAEKVQKSLNCRISYQVGTMIELPRAALKAGKIAKEVDFLSFGTNDLTQTTFGLSRDDAGSFLPFYRQNGILERDPFISLDQSGVGELILLACQRAREANPQIKLGVCGEHGGDPLSIDFFENAGLDYVSCSAYRVPIARLAAAQATLKKSRSF
jgi:pyruvate,orthophosphate dikinase